MTDSNNPFTCLDPNVQELICTCTGELDVDSLKQGLELCTLLGKKVRLTMHGGRFKKGVTRLPDNLRVKKTLQLDDCSGLTALPNGLSAKSLSLKGCVGLTCLPEDLRVHEKLDLSECTGLTALPEDLRVLGDINLTGCTGLSVLPRSIQAYSLNLRGCTHLRKLETTDDEDEFCVVPAFDNRTPFFPYNGFGDEGETMFDHISKTNRKCFLVKNTINFEGCTGLTCLPDNFNAKYEDHPAISLYVGHNICFKGCTGLTALPDNLHVLCREVFVMRPTVDGDDFELHEGVLDLTGCSALVALPRGLVVGKELILTGCSALSTLPDDMILEGSLELKNCKSLTALPTFPSGLKIVGDLSFSDCTGLSVLPDGLTVGGNLDLARCKSLTALPKSLKVKGSLNLNGCTGLGVLSDDLTVGGNLTLAECTGLSELPAGLSVGGCLDLLDCIHLRALPEMRVKGDFINVKGCISLAFLPENLSDIFEGNINGIDDCVALSEELRSKFKEPPSLFGDDDTY